VASIVRGLGRTASGHRTETSVGLPAGYPDRGSIESGLVNEAPDNPSGSTVAPAAPSTGAHDPDRHPPGIDGVSGFMGMRWDSANTVRLEIRPELINAAGLLSGVVTYALVDYCMGSTLWPHTTKEEHIATLNISINYIQTATEGEIVCTTELDRRNRTNAVLRSEVRHQDGRLLVTAIGSYAIFPARRRQRAT
jgi:1,4-dihydroxy-2-naphthoyl-CoA hydrolase